LFEEFEQNKGEGEYMPNNTSSLTLSVGIPTFNQADFLAQTLDSLLNQTRPPDEILVSDHHSTDHTLQVLSGYTARYADRIRIVQPPLGVNLTGQYNFTLSSLSSDWLTLLSSDDIARPHFCETLLRGAASSPDAVLVRSGWENIDAQENFVSQHYMLGVPKSEGPPSNLTAQKYGPKVNFAAFALKREAFLQSGPILSSIESLADWALFLQMAPYGSYVYEHALLSGYRVGHDGNKFVERLPQWTRDQQRVFNEVMPLAAVRCGIKDLAWITEASRYNFTRYLANASRQFAPSPELRVPVVALFQPWADSLSTNPTDPAQATLRAFAQGKLTRTSLPLHRRLKNKLRPLYQRFHSHLRRSS
jgi:glycosyltransferase involved in cell wall biosynthesis